MMQTITKYKWHVLIICLLIAGASAWSAFQLKINPDIESYLPDNISSKIHTDSIESIFGKSDPLLLVYQSPYILEANALEQLFITDTRLAASPCFNEHQSLFTVKEIRSSDEFMVVEKLLDYPFDTIPEKQSLQQRIENSRQAYGHLVSKDFTTALILLNADHRFEDAAIIEIIDSITASVTGPGKFQTYGPLYMRVEANQKITRDLMILMPLGLLIMIVFLFLSFRQKRAVLLPLSVVVLSILFSFGLMPLLGWDLSIIGILLPVMMIAIANDYGIHFITKYQELSVTQQDLTEEQIVINTARYLKKPILFTGITTIIGLSGMVLHIILPAKQMGIISSAGIALAVLMSLYMLPAMMAGIGKKSHQTGFLNNGNAVQTALASAAKIIRKFPKRLLLLFGALFLLTFTGFFRFEIARDFDSILHKDHPYSLAKKITDEHLGGTKNIRLLFQGDALDPMLLKRLDNYQATLEDLPEVGSAFSFSSLIREMTRAMNAPGEPEHDRIPDNRNSIAQYIELYNLSGDPADLEEFTDFNYEFLVMEIQFRTNGIHNTKTMRKKVEALVGNDPAYAFMGGYCLIEDQMNHYIALGQLYSLLFALFSIILVLSFVFRSVLAGLLGGLPLGVVVLATMGFMGYLGIELNIVTALISSISIGLGVDYTLHIFWRIKKERRKGVDWANAIDTSIVSTGYGVTINALSVIIGFSVLLFSSFGIIRDFSILIVLSISLCLLCSLLLIPAICRILKPDFLNR
jgi:hydrophobe/amphiphile efflux-3 (HAE3) family protein